MGVPSWSRLGGGSLTVSVPLWFALGGCPVLVVVVVVVVGVLGGCPVLVVVAAYGACLRWVSRFVRHPLGGCPVVVLVAWVSRCGCPVVGVPLWLSRCGCLVRWWLPLVVAPAVGVPYGVTVGVPLWRCGAVFELIVEAAAIR